MPKQLDQLQEFIWRRFEEAYPDEDEVNPIFIDFANGCYFVFFSDQVHSYGFNDVYTYMPAKRRWGIIYGNDAAGSYRNLGRKTTFKKILARVEKLMHPELYSENPGKVVPLDNWSGKNLPRVRHSTRGIGRVAGFTASVTDGRPLAYIHWEGNYPGGTWDIFSESFTILDGVKLKRFFTQWQKGMVSNPGAELYTVAVLGTTRDKVTEKIMPHYWEVIAESWPYDDARRLCANLKRAGYTARMTLTVTHENPGPYAKNSAGRTARVETLFDALLHVPGVKKAYSAWASGDVLRMMEQLDKALSLAEPADATKLRKLVKAIRGPSIWKENPAEAPRYLRRQAPAGAYQIFVTTAGSEYPLILDAPSIQVTMRRAKEAVAMPGVATVVIYDSLGNLFQRVL